MAIARILTVVNGEAGSENALLTALALGNAFRARVRVLHVAIDPERSLPLLGEGMTGAMVSDLTKSLEAEADRGRARARQLFETHCAEAGLRIVSMEDPAERDAFTVSFDERKGSEADVVAEEGRLFDLIVLPRSAAEEGPSGPTMEAALFESGRPVLVAGKEPFAAVPERIAVAWNGSREAARAVTVALPLLKHAKQVTILTGEGKDDPAVAHASSLARYLTYHGLEAQTWGFLPADWPVAQSLVAEAKKAGCTLLVMGAYGHSRLRELVLGGATRAALKDSDMALLMVH